MDYPVLVNPGKPSQGYGYEEENQGDCPARAAKRLRKASLQARQGDADSAHASASRSLDAVAPNDAKPTIRRLRTQLAQALARIDELQASADTDFLLDIPNRRGFERELNRSIAYIKRYHASGALIVLDVDRLKPINDAFGHAAGDQVLKAIVGRAVRARCAPPT